MCIHAIKKPQKRMRVQYQDEATYHRKDPEPNPDQVLLTSYSSTVPDYAIAWLRPDYHSLI